MLNANDSIKSKDLIPPGFKGKRFALAVEADNEDNARAFIQASFAPLSDVKDFGELYTATKYPYGLILELPD